MPWWRISQAQHLGVDAEGGMAHGLLGEVGAGMVDLADRQAPAFGASTRMSRFSIRRQSAALAFTVVPRSHIRKLSEELLSLRRCELVHLRP